MKADTNYRIKVYQQALPRMREKVFAALLMLVIAAVVAVTATYAWITLSFSPEVSKMTTTLAANGNLEIALAKADGSAPDEFDVDESVSINTDEVTVSNLQWGNLVNLSDPSYGISDIALRPARLNTASLLGNPLWGAVYSADGRVSSLNTDYAYVKYNAQASEYRVDNNYYGVRAIASYKAEVADSTMAAQQEKLADVAAAHQAVNDAYLKVRDAFTPLGSMVSAYAQEVVDEKLSGSATPADLGSYLNTAIGCYQAVYDAMLLQRDAYVALANYQSYIAMQNANMADQFVSVTWEELNKAPGNYNSADGTASNNGTIKLIGLTQFIKDMNTMKTDIETLTTYYKDWQTNGTPYYWGSKGDGAPAGRTISAMVSDLIEWPTMTVDLEDNGTEVKVLSLNTDMLTQIIAANNKSRKVYVYGGVMRRFEQNGVDDAYRINGEAACTIKIKAMGITITIKGKAYTKASGASTFMENYSVTVGSSSLAANDALAEDTYGLVVDLWLRTNAEETCLTLEGATTTDEDGSIMSYDGVNRVWGATGDAQLTTNSTTQGGGSCYVYYADTPEDMARSLSLLEAMKVAFVDANGTLLATADMDTEHYYAVNGRVTVPLVLDLQTKLTYTYTNDKNEDQIGRAITTMCADQSIRVTAIIYLDGDLLTNDDVLAESEIQGRLNIQFGSSEKLDTIGSNELLDDTRTVTAKVNKTELDFDTANSEEEKTVTLTAKVEGEGNDPVHVTASFLRAINSTQGSREEKMIFTKQQDGTWTADYTFSYPGTYYLRYVTLDGVEYTLDEPLKVTVKGFALSSVTWTESGDAVTLRTSDSQHSIGVTVGFASDNSQNQPARVEARFVRQDGNTVNVPLQRNSQGKWTGSATFTTSGVYTLQYLLLDGKYRDLADGNYAKTIDLSLGMYVSVRHIKGALSEMFIAKDEAGEDILYERSVAVEIYDNTGTVLGVEALGENVTPILYYSYGSSTAATINTDLTWNEDIGQYEGTFAINKAGRYRFFYVDLNGSRLTRCVDSPVYTLISPEPPAYDTSSYCTLNVDGIQYVPLTNDAKIDNIRINNADAATVQVVVYNETYGQFQTVETRVASEGVLYVALPTYQLPTGKTDNEGNPVLGAATQEGTWRVAAILLTECYDDESDYRGAENPIIWVDSGEMGAAYLEQNETVAADERYDFSALSTTVSSKVNVTMKKGTTALGDKNTTFGTVHYVKETGMSVQLTDGAGRVIPSNKVNSVTLSVTYDQSDAANYGYTVNTGAQTDDIALTYDQENGDYRVAANDTTKWRYVGEYKVNKLTVVIGGEKLEFAGGDAIGVPTQYTVTSAAPTAEDVTVVKQKDGNEEVEVKQAKTVFGKDLNGNVNGTFLQSYSLSDTYVMLTMKDSEGQSMRGVSLDGMAVTLKLTHAGKNSENGGYTFTDSTYKSLSIPMTQGQNSDSYNAGSSVLLAGEYKGEVVVTVGNSTQTYPLNKKIEVYSKAPDVTMALATGTPTTVAVNRDAGTTVSKNIFTGNNQILNNGHSALLYIAYAPFTAENNVGTYDKYTSTEHSADFADYTLPNVSFKLSGIENSPCTSFTLSIAGCKNILFSGVDVVEAAVGSIETGTDKRLGTYKGTSLTGGEIDKADYFTYQTEKPVVIGEQTVKTVTATDTGGTYTLELATELQLVQKNTAPPSITFAEQEGFVTPTGKTSEDGTTFAFTLPTVAQYGAVNSSGENETKKSDAGDSTMIQELPAIGDSLGWATKSSSVEAKVYTQEYKLSKDSHWVGTTGTYYNRSGTQVKYQINTLIQYATARKVLQGTSVATTTVQKYNRETVLDYWLVNGVRYAPGAVISKVDGNWVAEPVLKNIDTVYQTVVTTETTTGKTVEEYIATCTARETLEGGTTTDKDSTTYCTHGSNRFCDYYHAGDNAKTMAESWTMSAPDGYSLVETAPTIGIVRDLNGVEWVFESSAPVEGAATTTTTEVFDANGNLLSTTTN